MVKNKRGFTLIEILIVVAIIGLLTALILSGVNPATQMKKGRDGRRKADLEEIRTTLEMCRVDQGTYPGGISSPGTIDCNGNFYSIPGDPINSPPHVYIYTYFADSDSYTLCALLEVIDEDHCVSNP